MLLRGGRLGGISEDVLEFISSRDADKRIFEADLLVDRAHLVMLRDQGLISGEDSSRIIAVLDELDQAMLGEGEDVHEAIEAYIISRVGQIGGRMHTGRSRNDEVATCIRIALRSEMLSLMDELLSLIRTLVELADKHKDSLMPGFTHTQHAQPTTLAHHLLAHCDALSRDLARIRGAYSRVNLSPLGAAAFASTGFDIDREKTCRLLGFEGLMENSMDAVSSRDFILEVLSDLSILMVNLSRMAEELILWSTSEFGYVELDNRFASTSSIMPQKKNPDTAELARGKAGSVLGSLVSALTICKALPLSYNRDLQEVTPHLWRGMDWARSTVRIIEGCFSTARFNLQRMEASAGAGFSTATEIADSLVRITGIPFRTAHQIVGRLAAENQNPTIQDLDACAQNVADIKPSQMGYSAEDLKRALDPRSNVAVRSRIGGPAPSETARMIFERQKMLDAMGGEIECLRSNVDHALDALRGIR
ncbi:MAG TPA: argininosuccinate lyase [Methanotrichaceae archaeon]|nr:argininosuccinate lyase [Methanotrichaceae archaeon]